MEKYTQLSLQERVAIFEGLKGGRSRNMIALSMGRDKSTISREIRRNCDSNGYYYYPSEAQVRTHKRKAKHGFKVCRIVGMKGYVIEKLNEYWAPTAIAGRWSLTHPDEKITKEAIYAFIYGQEGKQLGLAKLLPQAKPKRGLVRARKAKSHIPNRVPLENRPKGAHMRSELGHLEGDLFFNTGSQSSNVLTLVDRKSRLVRLVKNSSKKSDLVVNSVSQVAQELEAKTITFDNGSEFSSHTKLREQGDIMTYFCEPGAPWQKGSVENMNKQIRRFLPFKFNASDITQETVDMVADILNNIPREVLGFRTPYEVHGNIDLEIVKRKSRVKMATPAMEAGFFDYKKQSSVALHY